MKTWLKAGLVGGIVGIVLTLPAFLAFYLPLTLGSIISTCASIVFLLLYPSVGALAAFWLPIPRETKQGAIDGALAGLVAFGIDTIATIVLTLIVMWTGGLEQYMSQFAPYLSPDTLAITNTFSIALIVGCSCINVLVGALFSALGGFVFASVKPN
jgi:hypothetical protein